MTDGVAPIGLIAGSGLQSLRLFENPREIDVNTPFGKPSAPLVRATISGMPVAFVRRHGIGHHIPPTDINVRANVAALKQLGVRQVISLSAVGSLIEAAAPGTFVMIDQFIDRTFARPKTFFGQGVVGHVAFGNPVCERLRLQLVRAGKSAGIPTIDGGTYVVMEGPQFSTKAESALYRSWGASIIGMTAMPEAKLCREAELCYGLVAMVTDFDSWHEDHEHVTAAIVSDVMSGNAEKAARLLQAALPSLSTSARECPHGCDRALDGAIMTAREAYDPSMVAKLAGIMERVL